MSTKKIYRTVWTDHKFADQDFNTVEEAEAFKEEYVAGCPTNTHMSDENREYWKEQGRKIEIHLIEEKFIGIFEPKTP